MSWFIRRLRLHDFTQYLSDIHEMICAKPPRLRGKKIASLSDANVCPEAGLFAQQKRLALIKHILRQKSYVSPVN